MVSDDGVGILLELLISTKMLGTAARKRRRFLLQTGIPSKMDCKGANAYSTLHTSLRYDASSPSAESIKQFLGNIHSCSHEAL